MKREGDCNASLMWRQINSRAEMPHGLQTNPHMQLRLELREEGKTARKSCWGNGEKKIIKTLIKGQEIMVKCRSRSLVKKRPHRERRKGSLFNWEAKLREVNFH